MHKKPESDLQPIDSELERTLRSLRKVSRAEKATMADERIDQKVEQETAAERPSIQDKMEDFWRPVIDECKTHLCFKFISHAILCILYPYSCKTHKISSKLGFLGLLMKIK